MEVRGEPSLESRSKSLKKAQPIRYSFRGSSQLCLRISFGLTPNLVKTLFILRYQFNRKSTPLLVSSTLAAASEPVSGFI